MKLWLDDIRDAPDETWEVCRTAEEALEQIYMGGINVISFDHDLGENVPTGYDVLKVIEVRQAYGVPAPTKMVIHSANPVGRKNMQAAIDSIERMRNAKD